MKIIKVSTELEMSVHEFPEGTMRERIDIESAKRYTGNQE